jgi:ABC-2 type transport system ATP-binding protein
MIEAIGLTKHYGSTVAVDNLSFTVRPGAVTGFLGPNGAGKSTTMRMILGLDNPTQGKALIAGQSYAHLSRPLTQVGSLLDANWIHPNRSARAHLRFMAASNKIPVKRVDEVLDIVGLSSVAKKAAGKFSLGMKQRLGLAGALLGDPQVLLFDEPVNGLDPEGIYWIRTFMKNLAIQGRTVFVSSHLLSEMALTADHLIVIGRGRLIAEASTADFISQSTRTSVRVRSPQLADLRTALVGAGLAVTDVEGALEVTGAPIEQIGDIAGQANVTLHELATQSGSLEEAFIQLTGDSVEYGHSRAHDRQPPGPPGPGLAVSGPPVAGPPVSGPPLSGPPVSGYAPGAQGPMQQGGELR